MTTQRGMKIEKLYHKARKLTRELRDQSWHDGADTAMRGHMESEGTESFKKAEQKLLKFIQDLLAKVEV